MLTTIFQVPIATVRTSSISVVTPDTGNIQVGFPSRQLFIVVGSVGGGVLAIFVVSIAVTLSIALAYSHHKKKIIRERRRNNGVLYT